MAFASILALTICLGTNAGFFDGFSQLDEVPNKLSLMKIILVVMACI